MDTTLTAFDRRFYLLHARSLALIIKIPESLLFSNPLKSPSTTMFSCGEFILRSAAMVEKTFGGITTRLWDDPFEWTLPEKLSDSTAILGYLDEVEATRQKGFAFFTSDDDLKREIPAPERLTPIIDILLDTLGKAEHFQGRAYALFQLQTGDKPPRL